MSCCGHKRALLYGAIPIQHSNSHTAASMPPPQATVVSAVTFEYLGETGVSAVGAITRKLYRFAGKHTQLAVDARDAPSIAAVPNLRRIR